MDIERTIVNIGLLVDGLDEKFKYAFNKIYRWYSRVGSLRLSQYMERWAREKLGDCDHQNIIRITNRYTLESTLFNEFRTRRPMDAKLDTETVDEKCNSFCNPLENTPEDCFGRVFGEHSVTASNIAKYDYVHGLVIFKDHDPFVHELEKIRDYFSVAEEWFKRAREYYPDAIYPVIVWNCLWRAGASIIHGHMQLLLSHEPYSRYESYIRAHEAYKAETNRNYFDDLIEIYERLSLGVRVGESAVLAYLTPSKEKEFFVISRKLSELSTALSMILKFYRELGVSSFNMITFIPTDDLSSQVPIIMRIVDRGPLSLRTSDIGAMELLAGTSVVATDPFRLADGLRNMLKNILI